MMPTRTLLLAAAAAFALTGGAAAQEVPRGQAGTLGPDGLRTAIAKPGASDLSKATVADGFTFLAAGDLLGPHNSLTALNDPEFGKVTEIIQGADAAFANHEGSGFDLNTFNGTHAAQNGGGYPRFEPSLQRDFKAMGLDMVSMANNHGGDWGEQGLVETIKSVTEAGLVEAGAGGSMAQARAPGLFETPHGRVALIATASTFNPATPAADAEGALKPRPGISVLRTTSANVVTEAEMAALRPVAAARGRVAPEAKQVRLGNSTFKVGAKPGLTYTVNAQDQDAILASITKAKQANDFVAFSIHAHETAGGDEDATPGDFLPVLFHKAIDAGADLVIRHGPHATNGIEIYKGKPIFYSMGSLFFGVGGPERTYNGGRMPDAWYDGAIALTEYKGGKPSVIRVYPLKITTDRPATFSAPNMATGADAQRILGKIQKDSVQFGTDMKIENGVGVIRIAG